MNRYFAWFGLPGSFVLSGLLVLLSFILAVFRCSAIHRWLCFFAMLFCFFGDLLMMDFMDISRWLPWPTMNAGACVFMLGHLFYALTYYTKGLSRGYRIVNPGFYAGLLLCALLVALLTYFAKRFHLGSKSFLTIAFIYVFVICLSGSFVLSYCWSARKLAILTAAGFLCFLFSDLLIGFKHFSPYRFQIHGLSMDSAIWWYYPIGQILLILGSI